MPRTLHPAVVYRRKAPTVRLTDTTQLGDPLLLLSAAASGLSSLSHAISAISGSSHKYAGTTFEGAEQARADAGALGVAAGSVQAGRYLLAQHNTNTSPYAQSATAAAISQADAANPIVMQQARGTPLTNQDKDQADGTGVLGILWQYKVPFTDPYAGYSTSTGGPGSQMAMQLATQLRALPPIASGPAPSPVVMSSGTQTLPVVSQPTLTPADIASAAQPTLNTLQSLAQQLASGALSLSQLGTLASNDLAYVQAQAKAIQAGQVPKGGVAVWVGNNKPLVYGAGVGLLALLIVPRVTGWRHV